MSAGTSVTLTHRQPPCQPPQPLASRPHGNLITNCRSIAPLHKAWIPILKVHRHSMTGIVPIQWLPSMETVNRVRWCHNTLYQYAIFMSKSAGLHNASRLVSDHSFKILNLNVTICAQYCSLGALAPFLSKKVA
ncbi:hypothetical protein BDZ91DRAFT_292607 [Kalaharituber pfeilii]|nr:hypothetical protein BDZ91DRAFT_292607 [Kalaharituber pfeilii]